MATFHKFGIALPTGRAVFFGVVDDDEFNSATADGLPPKWFAFHFDESELSPRSGRVAEIARLPLVHTTDGRVADWKTELEHARRFGVFHVELWGSDPDDGNDDCWIGDEFADPIAAREFYGNPWTNKAFARCKPSAAFIVIRGNGVYEKRENPDYDPRPVDDDDWHREHARQCGMLGGVDAYNDARGY